jgi:Ca2+-binding RTX toxin-like protein
MVRKEVIMDEERKTMKKAITMTLVALVALALTASAALALDLVGDEGPNVLKGTKNADFLDGHQGSDKVLGKGNPIGTSDVLFGDTLAPPDTATDGDDKVSGSSGDDQLIGYGGNDTLSAGSGNDIIDATEQSDNPGVDKIKCGGGTDTVFADDDDIISKNCEDVNPSSAAEAKAEIDKYRR